MKSHLDKSLMDNVLLCMANKRDTVNELNKIDYLETSYRINE